MFALHVLCTGESHYADKWYQSHIGDGWQQTVSKERDDYTNVSVARRLNVSRQNCGVSERIVSAAEQLFMLASAQTTSFPKQNGFVHCRSSSQDSGLGKDSDSGSSSSGSQVSGPNTHTSRNCQYIEDPQHPSSQSLSQLLNQPVCTVLPMRNCGRNTSHTTARQCDAPRYPNPEVVQQETFQQLNRCEVFSNRSPQLARQHGHQPEFTGNFSCRDGKQHWEQRFPVAENVAYYGNMVNPLHYAGSRMPNAHQLSHSRVDTNGQAMRYTSMYRCSRSQLAECIPPAGDTAALMAEQHLRGTSVRTSTFDYRHGQSAYSHLASAERRDELLYYKHHNVNAACQPAVDSHRDSTDVARYRAVQQRYQPYEISTDVRRGNGTIPCGSSRNLFCQTSQHSLMQLRHNDELFYTSGIH